MANLEKIPLIDGFETTLAQAYTGGLGTMYVNDVPAFTFPSGVKTYAVVNPGKSTQQVVEIDSKGAGTLNVSSTTVEKGAGVNYTAQTHAAGNKVIISDNYQFWKDIRTAINTKLDDDGGNGKEYADTAARDAALGGDGVATKNYRMVKAGPAYYNYNLSLGQWQVVSTGTAPLNGNEATAGIFQQSTDAAFLAGTDLGSTGSQNTPKNSQIKAALDVITPQTNAVKSKSDVVVATTANITLSGTQTIDGIAVTAGQRVLVKNQSTASQNGIYLCAAGAWTRTTDFDSNVNNEVDLGAEVWVQGGTVNAGTMWTLSTAGAITIGTTSIAFEAIGGFGNLNYKKTSITSTTARISANTERTSNTTAPGVLVKSFRCPFSGIVNVYQELKNLTGGFTTTATIYRNGDTTGISSTNNITSYVASNNDVVVGEGDIIDIYLATNNAGQTAYIQNARLRYDISAGNVGVVITD